jgi:hypothetical protein
MESVWQLASTRIKLCRRLGDHWHNTKRKSRGAMDHTPSTGTMQITPKWSMLMTVPWRHVMQGLRMMQGARDSCGCDHTSGAVRTCMSINQHKASRSTTQNPTSSVYLCRAPLQYLVSCDGLYATFVSAQLLHTEVWCTIWRVPKGSPPLQPSAIPTCLESEA